MDLRQIRYFTTVCAEGSFSRAAQRLHMTQPPLSTSIAGIERELGVKLLDRTQHGVVPTEAGRYLALKGEQILALASQVEEHLRDLGQGRGGSLTVAAVPTFAWEFMPMLLRRFGEVAPNADITLIDPPAMEALDAVRRGWADVGIVVTTDAEQLARFHAGQQLRVEKVRDLAIVAVLPASWEDSPDPLDALELIDEEWIMPGLTPMFPGIFELVDRLWREWAGIVPKFRYVHSLQTALPLVAGGIGVSLMPETVLRFPRAHTVVRTLKQPVPPMHAAVVWRDDAPLAPLQRRFLDLVFELRDRDLDP